MPPLMPPLGRPLIEPLRLPLLIPPPLLPLPAASATVAEKAKSTTTAAQEMPRFMRDSFVGSDLLLQPRSRQPTVLDATPRRLFYIRGHVPMRSLMYVPGALPYSSFAAMSPSDGGPARSWTRTTAIKTTQARRQGRRVSMWGLHHHAKTKVPCPVVGFVLAPMCGAAMLAFARPAPAAIQPMRGTLVVARVVGGQRLVIFAIPV